MSLLDWYWSHARDLPWRSDRIPYRILVSEFMCQQTTVGVAAPYFLQWIERFPDEHTLSRASLTDVMGVWAGLGYYRRARNLQACAQAVVDHGWPKDFRSLCSLPGVGEYTAAAVASICYGEVVPAIDGNAKRVYSRLAGNGSTGQTLYRSAREWATRTMDQENPGEWNQALMELGAQVCRPMNPDCGQCPFGDQCVAKREGATAKYPRRLPKRKVGSIAWDVCVFESGGKVAVRQAQSGEWCEGMWAFPVATPPKGATRIGSSKHTITTNRIVSTIWSVSSLPEGYETVETRELASLAMPAIFAEARRQYFSWRDQRLQLVDDPGSDACDDGKQEHVQRHEDHICQDREPVSPREPLLRVRPQP